MTPLFILSLPRSGSTLLQRVLGQHDEIATIAEPWVLLPICYSLRREGVAAIYDHANQVRAAEDLCRHLPHGREDYLGLLGQAVQKIYATIGNGQRYFLDKTPRYHLIWNDLLSVFPEAKCIVLWRNPLAIAASMMATWSQERWNLHRFYVDLYAGVVNLTRFVETFGDRVIDIQFEDFIKTPAVVTAQICRYLEIEYDPKVLDNIERSQIRGQMGDKSGAEQYERISSDVLHKWHRLFSNPVRKKWARHYLGWIGAERLRLMGYDPAQIEAELGAVRSSGHRLISDCFRIPYSYAYHLFQKMRRGEHVV